MSSQNTVLKEGGREEERVREREIERDRERAHAPGSRQTSGKKW